jgi:hypothetical protein
MSKRVAMTAAGAILVVGGGVVALGGGALAVAFGSDSAISSGHNHVSSMTTALVSEQASIERDAVDVLGHPTVRIAVSGSDKPVFVGVARAADVDRYLAGAAVETVTDFDVRPFVLDSDVRGGSSQVASPLDQTFWVARSDGASSAATTWKFRDGNYRVVVMNADGSAGIDTDARFTLRVPHLTAIGGTALAAGLVLMGFGLLLIVAGIRAKDAGLPDGGVGAAEPAQELVVTP